MTTAAGFVCVDGVVLCADTQYTSTTVKLSEAKIFAPQNPDLHVLVAAAGNAVLMKKAAEDIFRTLDSRADLNGIKIAAEGALELIFTDYVDKAPYDPDYTVDVLVAAQTHDGAALFEHSRGAVTQVPDNPGVRCIGSGGATLGAYIAHMMFQPRSTTRVACIVAAHLLEVAKRYDPHSGFDSDIRSMIANTGEVVTIHPLHVKNLEKFFARIYEELRPLLFIAPDPIAPASALGQQLKVFESALRQTPSFPYEYRHFEGQIVEPQIKPSKEEDS